MMCDNIKCEICNELECGIWKPFCIICVSKMAAIIECKTCEKAEELVRMFFKYPTSKSALITKV